ncbi:antibiotic biosynthesis monooxygenase [Kitasatospora sp. SUK 42]|uniref:antibiotic biosynthesis monooxygenase family protein n=1 Tax=Kitasatospora sp. SUK 42 TaxID=1588882 RepID=UPI0018CA2815|nr:antibiotic biosynthesis monooxygenase family protein [Kitasatospora sp. SUK 42]MBV2153189.1 antibiotic biosynthesis monooxygenase [Kitasatospora sp. SUK 42]
MPNEEHVSPEAPGGAEVTFVNRFTVHGPAEEFEEVFDRTSAFMARQPGFVRHTLLREVDDPAGYVNLAVWRDRDSFRRAVGHPDFVPHATALRSLSRSENGLYAARLSRPAADGTDRPVRTDP